MGEYQKTINRFFKVIISNIEFDSRYNLRRANKYMRYRLTSTEDEKFSICPENWAFHWPNYRLRRR